jgi:urease subunit gamma/beta
MRLTPWEEERLLVFTAAELARRHRAAGQALNAPETIALICDAMFEAARGGGDYAAIELAGRSAVRLDEVMPGVRALVDEVFLEVLIGDGTRLVALLDPLAPPGDAGATRGPGARDQLGAADAPGAIIPNQARPPEAGNRASIELTVRSASRRVIHVSSHFPFHRVNPRLEFDREVARGYRLDLPSGASERWAPGEARTVRLVRFFGGGSSGRPGATGDPGRLDGPAESSP